MQRSRFPAFYKLSVPERVRAVRQRGLLSSKDYQALSSGEHTLTVGSADKMIENVIGVMGLPVGLGLNFLVNEREYVVPLAVEEPSIVAALSSAAKLAGSAGGFTATSTEPILIGQIQVVDIANATQAKAALLERREEILNLANSLQPKLVARGGGAVDMEVGIHPTTSGTGDMVVVHLLVDTRDAMGANLVNTMCEGVAPLVETIANGKVFLRILSNLTDRALVRAETTIPVDDLAGKGYTGEQVRDGVVLASEFAAVDPYRAATHNKGIMNGMDALALATGNDWRALEAAAHAYAARGGQYTSLSRWECTDDGDLHGVIEVPAKVGIVGGPLESNPTVAVNLRMLGVQSARELAEVMGSVGLAQNFAALRALATEGIQRGHMTLHARSVATVAGATPEIFDQVVDRLLESGEIKIWKARELVDELQSESAAAPAARESGQQARAARGGEGHAAGKVILMGEHAAVYGRHVVAAPVPLAVQARAEEAEEGVELLIPRWGVEDRLPRERDQRDSFQSSLALILSRLGLDGRAMRIQVDPAVPRAMGLGGSAAMAVAIIRALDDHYRLGLSDQDVNELAYECEKIAHGTPSGIDNTMATYGHPLLFRGGDEPIMQNLSVTRPIRLVLGMSGIESLTAKMVGRVRAARDRDPKLYERIFDEIDSLALGGVEAIGNHDMPRLGELMNVCQGLLNALGVSSWELEEMVQIARDNGALGAKLTGGGGGGSMVALCPDDTQRVVDAIRAAGYQAMEIEIGGNDVDPD